MNLRFVADLVFWINMHHAGQDISEGELCKGGQCKPSRYQQRQCSKAQGLLTDYWHLFAHKHLYILY